MKNQAWKTTLGPFAIVIGGMISNIEAMEDAELLELHDACLEPTTTNCWCCTYQAAKTIAQWVDEEISRRLHLKPQA